MTLRSETLRLTTALFVNSVGGAPVDGRWNRLSYKPCRWVESEGQRGCRICEVKSHGRSSDPSHMCSALLRCLTFDDNGPPWHQFRGLRSHLGSSHLQAPIMPKTDINDPRAASQPSHMTFLGCAIDVISSPPTSRQRSRCRVNSGERTANWSRHLSRDKTQTREGQFNGWTHRRERISGRVGHQRSTATPVGRLDGPDGSKTIQCC